MRIGKRPCSTPGLEPPTHRRALGAVGYRKRAIGRTGDRAIGGEALAPHPGRGIFLEGSMRAPRLKSRPSPALSPVRPIVLSFYRPIALSPYRLHVRRH